MIDGVLQAATATIAQAIGQATSSIKALIDEAIATVQSSIAKAATSVASLQGAAETTVQLAANQAQTAVGQAVATVTNPAAGGLSTAGVLPGQYAFNVFSLQTPKGWTNSGIFNADQAKFLAGQVGHCFLGSWENFYDALNFQQSPQFSQVAAQCQYPGGLAPPTPPSGPTSGCTQWAVWVFPSGTTSLCSYPYCDGSVPDPTGLGGHKVLFPDQASANAFASSQTCQTGGTGGGPTQYYAGCGADGQPVSWAAGSTPPAGVTGQIGPYDSQADALAAVGQCAPPPPPPTGGPTGGTGSGCCDPVTGAVKLPDCIMLDLCDWDKFTQAVYKALCLWVQDPNCHCPTMDSERYIFEDCDGQVDAAVSAWSGKVGGVVTNNSVDDLIGQASDLGASFAGDVADTGPELWSGGVG